jgi:hypothetical protein
VAQYQRWHSINSGTVSAVAQYQRWHNISCGTVSTVAQYQQWHSISSGTVSAVEQYQRLTCWTDIYNITAARIIADLKENRAHLKLKTFNELQR